MAATPRGKRRRTRWTSTQGSLFKYRGHESPVPSLDDMRITHIDCHVLLDPGYDVGATSSSQDDIVVEIHTDEGVTGIGESDVNPWIGRACIEAPGTHTMGLGLTQMLVGGIPLTTRSIVGKTLCRLGNERTPRCDDPRHRRTGHGAP